MGNTLKNMWYDYKIRSVSGRNIGEIEVKVAWERLQAGRPILDDTGLFHLHYLHCYTHEIIQEKWHYQPLREWEKAFDVHNHIVELMCQRMECDFETLCMKFLHPSHQTEEEEGLDAEMQPRRVRI